MVPCSGGMKKRALEGKEANTVHPYCGKTNAMPLWKDAEPQSRPNLSFRRKKSATGKKFPPGNGKSVSGGKGQANVMISNCRAGPCHTEEGASASKKKNERLKWGPWGGGKTSTRTKTARKRGKGDYFRQKGSKWGGAGKGEPEVSVQGKGTVKRALYPVKISGEKNCRTPGRRRRRTRGDRWKGGCCEKKADGKLPDGKEYPGNAPYGSHVRGEKEPWGNCVGGEKEKKGI